MAHQGSSALIRSHSWLIRVITCTRMFISVHSGLVRARQGSSGLIRDRQGSSGLIRDRQGSPPREERRRDAREA